VITWDELTRLAGCSHDELRRFVEERWVEPENGDGFGEVDVARVQLIIELRRDLSVNDDAMPLVLSLLDQVYALRRQVRALAGGQRPGNARAE
jgi:chaperone modulatory protein CbpM